MPDSFTRRGVLAGVVPGLATGGAALGEANRARRRRGKRTKPSRPERPGRPNDPERPHILFVVFDDLADAEWAYLPETAARLDTAGTRFPNAICANPVCAPARASLLTGRRSDRTGVLTNADGANGLAGGQLFPTLAARGYRTAGWGKTLNGYRGQFAGFASYDPWVGVAASSGRGGFVRDGRHDTVYYRQEIAAWLAANPSGPVAIYLAPVIPHKAYVPHPADDRRYPEIADEERRLRAQMLAGADRMLAGILDALAAQRRLDRTLVVVCSDNGYAFGHNGIPTKGGPYRPSTQVTLRTMGPGIAAGATDNRLVAPEDIPVTIAANAGTAIRDADGLDLRTDERQQVLMQYYGSSAVGQWQGLRGPGWTFVAWADGRREYFDLEADPDEATNRYDDLPSERRTALEDLLAAELGS